MHYYDVITNPRWRTTANMKIASAYLCENDPIMTQFGTLNQIVILIKMISPKFSFLKAKMADGRHIENIVFSRLSDIYEKLCEEPRWRTTAILKIVISPDFSEIS